jgi:hypothetical protein
LNSKEIHCNELKNVFKTIFFYILIIFCVFYKRKGDDNVKEVIWISRHRLLVENHLILRNAFGEYCVVEVNERMDANRLKEIVEELGRDRVYVVVLPTHLIKVLLDLGVEVYRFITKDVEGRNLPVGLERIVDLEIERVV